MIKGEYKMDELTNEMQKFLVASAFGNVFKNDSLDLKDDRDIFLICAKVAYLDLARVLKYNENHKNSEDYDKNQFKKTICSNILKYYKNEKNNIRTIIDKIKKDVNDAQYKDLFEENFIFTYGMAQKWVNMTLKYFWLFDKVKNSEELDIPIDSYVIDALFKKGILKEEDFNTGNLKNLKKIIEKPLKISKRTSEKLIPWSQWDSDKDIKMYEVIQKKVKDFCDKSKPKIGIMVWENNAWIEQSRMEV